MTLFYNLYTINLKIYFTICWNGHCNYYLYCFSYFIIYSVFFKAK